VHPDALELLRRERTGSLPDPTRHADSAEVVDECGPATGRDVAAVESGRARRGGDQPSHVARVTTQPRRLQIGEVLRAARRRDPLRRSWRTEWARRRAPPGRGLPRSRSANAHRDRRRCRPRQGRTIGRTGNATPRRRWASRPHEPTAPHREPPSRSELRPAPPHRTGQPVRPCRPNARRRAPTPRSRSDRGRVAHRASRRRRSEHSSSGGPHRAGRSPVRPAPSCGGADVPLRGAARGARAVLPTRR
jgi:hypothetical protein